MSEVNIHIHGGNNQILPNATQGIQNFYGDEYRPQPQTDQVIVQQAFIELLPPYLNRVPKGKTVSNLRTAINNALEKRKEAQRRSKQLPGL